MVMMAASAGAETNYWENQDVNNLTDDWAETGNVAGVRIYDGTNYAVTGENTYSGNTMIHGGGLKISTDGGTATRITASSAIEIYAGGTLEFYHPFNGSSTYTNQLVADDIPVHLRGGTLYLHSRITSASAMLSQKIGALNSDYGHGTVHLLGRDKANPDPTNTLQFASLSRATGSTLLFSREYADGTPTLNIFLDSQAEGIMDAWAVAYKNYRYDFVWYDASGEGAIKLGDNVTRTTSLSAGGHVNTDGGSMTLSDDAVIDSLRIRSDGYNDGVNHNLNGNQLTITSGGLLNSRSAYTLTNGSLTTGNDELFLHHYDGSCTIAANIVGDMDVTTCGGMILSGTNTFSGDLYVNNGTVTLSGSNDNMGEAHVAPGAALSLSPDVVTADTAIDLLFDGRVYGKVDVAADSDTVIVGTLKVGGETLSSGEYTAESHPDFISGAGTLCVPPSSAGTVFILR